MNHIVRGLYTTMIYLVLFNVQLFIAGQEESYIQFLVLRRSVVGNVHLNVLKVMYSFTNAFQKQPAPRIRCSSSWADRVWWAGRKASCSVRTSGQGRPGGPPGPGTPGGSGERF